MQWLQTKSERIQGLLNWWLESSTFRVQPYFFWSFYRSTNNWLTEKIISRLNDDKNHYCSQDSDHLHKPSRNNWNNIVISTSTEISCVICAPPHQHDNSLRQRNVVVWALQQQYFQNLVACTSCKQTDPRTKLMCINSSCSDSHMKKIAKKENRRRRLVGRRQHGLAILQHTVHSTQRCCFEVV